MTNLVFYLSLFFAYLVIIKNNLYMIKRVVNLKINYNKNIINKKHVLIFYFKDKKVDLVKNIICKIL